VLHEKMSELKIGRLNRIVTIGIADDYDPLMSLISVSGNSNLYAILYLLVIFFTSHSEVV
jgi:hypothetical protein